MLNPEVKTCGQITQSRLIDDKLHPEAETNIRYLCPLTVCDPAWISFWNSNVNIVHRYIFQNPPLLWVRLES